MHVELTDVLAACAFDSQLSPREPMTWGQPNTHRERRLRDGPRLGDLTYEALDPRGSRFEVLQVFEDARPLSLVIARVEGAPVALVKTPRGWTCRPIGSLSVSRAATWKRVLCDFLNVSTVLIDFATVPLWPFEFIVYICVGGRPPM